MIYTLFIYQQGSGLLVYEFNFQTMDTEKVALFSSFFSAMNAFISQLVLKGSKTLKNIELGDYTIFISSEPKLKVELVIIADKTDENVIKGLLPKLKDVIADYEDLFLNYKGNIGDFKILDKPISEVITAKSIEKESQTDSKGKSESFLNAIYSKDENHDEKQFHITHERLLSLIEFEKTNNIAKKIAIGNKIIDLSDKLNDDALKMEYQDKITELKNELDSAKIKLKYYLEKTKNSILEAKNTIKDRSLKKGNFRDAYLNLYSFSTKLKKVTGSDDYIKYKQFATNLIEKELISEEDFIKLIENLLNLSDNIEDYLT